MNWQATSISKSALSLCCIYNINHFLFQTKRNLYSFHITYSTCLPSVHHDRPKKKTAFMSASAKCIYCSSNYVFVLTELLCKESDCELLSVCLGFSGMPSSCRECGSSNVVRDDLYLESQLVCEDCGTVLEGGQLTTTLSEEAKSRCNPAQFIQFHLIIIHTWFKMCIYFFFSAVPYYRSTQAIKTPCRNLLAGKQAYSGTSWKPQFSQKRKRFDHLLIVLSSSNI